MLAKFDFVPTGSDEFKLDNGDILYFLYATVVNNDGSSAGLKLRSRDIDFKNVPPLVPQTAEADVKLHSKDGKTTTLEIQAWSIKPYVAK